MSLLIPLLAVVLSACDNNNEVDNYELVGTHGYQIVYRSFDELAQGATDVIRGEVLDKRVELRNTMLPYYVVLKELDEELSEEEMLARFPDYLGEELGWLDSEPFYEVVTIHRVRALEVFKGNYQIGDITEVMQPGGTYENTTVYSSDFVPFQSGADLVLFIHSRTHIGRAAVLLNSFQSVYRFPTIDENARSLDLNVELENVYGDVHYNNLSITLNDLLRLAEDQY